MINLGSKIKQLRRARGLTQEQFAAALLISPQAVSKWESGGGYPDITMIPTLANFFDVTLDELFDFDITQKNQKIEDIRLAANQYFWSDLERAEQILLDGIKEFPASELLKSELLSLYTTHVCSKGRTDLIGRAEDMARRLVVELTDIFPLCSAKEALVDLYMLQDKYDDAKAIVATLPYMFPYMLNDRMRTAAYHLRGEDRLAGARDWKIIETQELFIACAQEGEGYFEIGDDAQALAAFIEAVDVVERFMTDGKYPIGGTETNHMCYYLAIAGCHYRRGNIPACETALTRAAAIAHTALEARYPIYRPGFVKTMINTYRRYGLDGYVAAQTWYEQNGFTAYVPLEELNYPHK